MMAIKFTGKDQPKAAPAAAKAKAPAEKAARETASVKDEAQDGTDLFDAGAKAPGKRKPKGR
jgi:hypothetical protein